MGKAITIEVPTSRTSVIALDSIKKKNVIAHGKKVGTVIDKAKQSGVDEPVLMFVPHKGQRYIY